MTKDEALKLALEALRLCTNVGMIPMYLQANQTAITAIKEALAQPETDWERVARIKEEMLRVSFEDNKRLKEALAQPEQEPVGLAEHGVINWLADKQFNHTSFLYDTPAQRTWVDLTDGEIEAAIPYKNLSGEYYYDDVLNIVLLIQAKLKRKNI